MNQPASIAASAPNRTGRLDAYELLDELGGGQSVTRLARVRATGELVVVKMVDVQKSADWKAVELFEREVAVLESLDHPAIPKVLDSFVDERPGRQTLRLCMVQEYVFGTNLARAVQQGFRVDEDQARQLTRELLDILAYLHQQDPPVIHRDLKPANIIHGDDGRLHLVDFGAVGRFVPAGTGSTVVGSAGYVPNEQLVGRAQPASDLYALGATLVFLLSRRPPSELPVEHMRVQFRQAVNVSDGFAEFLEKLLDPNPKKRPQSVFEAQGMLDTVGSKLPVRWSGSTEHLPGRYRPPRRSKMTITRTADKLEVVIPPHFIWGLHLIMPVGFTVLAAGLAFLNPRPLFAAGMVIVMLVMWFLHYRRCATTTRVRLTAEEFEVEREVFGKTKSESVIIDCFGGLELERHRRGGPAFPALATRDFAGFNRKVRFGDGLSRKEKLWLIDVFEPANV